MVNHRKTKKATKATKATKYLPVVPGPGRCHPRVQGSRKTHRNNGNVVQSCLPAPIFDKLSKTSDCAPSDEKCLIEKSDLSPSEKKKLLAMYFRPDMPNEWKKKLDTWLTNEDIEKVLKQYEEVYKDFHFLGVVPIDFSAPDIYGDKSRCLNDQFCHIKIQEERQKGTRIIGAVFNLDHHLKGGSHWVACAIDLKRNRIYYFDSYGMQTPVQISRFMKSFILQDNSLKLERNGRRFQYGNSECGMYSTYFIIRMIMGDSFKEFVRRPIADKEMIELRKKLFYERT
jgi:hypothetical protein